MEIRSKEYSCEYLIASEWDENWGLFSNGAGHGLIEPHVTYPPEGHPSGYKFSWDKGRILQDFTLVYITKGKGVFESHAGTVKLDAGSLFLLRPGQWHRYRPAPETGWQEFWIAFNGRIAENIFSQDYFPADKPVMDIGYSEQTIRMFVQAVELALEMPHAYQPRLAAHIMHILALALNAQQTGNSSHEKMVQRIRCALAENLQRNIRMEEVASSLNISYTIFRRTFKAQTGLTPGQYHLQLRINRAKDLLAGTDLPVSRIAYQLGFESPYYFSRIFKKKVGMSPQRWRTRSSPKKV